MATLYDRTDIYDLFENVEKFQAVKKHWVKVLEGKEIQSLLDVSIGTGSLTLPVAELGISLYGSDLNGEMLAKCKQKADWHRVPINLRECDFRKLTEKFEETFDCVSSTGNSLPHVPNEDLEKTLEQMDRLVKKGGYLYYDMRNWDKILEEHNRFHLYEPMFTGDTRVNLVQLWDYCADGSMEFHLLYAFEKNGRTVQKEVFDERYYPISREKVIRKIQELGYRKIQVMCHPAYFEQVPPERADWYCVMAQK